MYSPESHQDTLEKLISICKATDYIEGVILVGSRSSQFPDEWADIDVSIVVNPASKTKDVWNTLNQKFWNSFEIITLGLTTYSENNYISIMLLKDYLEVDAGVISLDNLEAKKDRWKILFEKRDRILKKMQQSHEERLVPDSVQFIRNRVSIIGHYIRTFAVAIKRNQPFRATKELEDTRNIVVEMWAVQNGKIAKHFKDVDEADSSFRQKLASTFPVSLELDELTTAFNNTFNLFFELAEDIDQENKEIVSVKEEMKRLLETFGLRK